MFLHRHPGNYVLVCYEGKLYRSTYPNRFPTILRLKPTKHFPYKESPYIIDDDNILLKDRYWSLARIQDLLLGGPRH